MGAGKRWFLLPRPTPSLHAPPPTSQPSSTYGRLGCCTGSFGQNAKQSRCRSQPESPQSKAAGDSLLQPWQNLVATAGAHFIWSSAGRDLPEEELWTLGRLGPGLAWDFSRPLGRFERAGKLDTLAPDPFGGQGHNCYAQSQEEHLLGLQHGRYSRAGMEAPQLWKTAAHGRHDHTHLSPFPLLWQEESPVKEQNSQPQKDTASQRAQGLGRGRQSIQYEDITPSTARRLDSWR